MLNRKIGGPLPTRMLSEAERKENVLWEKKYHTDDNNTNDTETMVLATFQAEIINASLHDPIFKAFAKAGSFGAAPPEDWTTTIAYYDPCHVRYRRWRGTAFHVELFLCPTSQGRSRVFLFNAIERQEHGIPRGQQKTPRRQFGQILTSLKPSTWKTSLMRLVFQKMSSGHRGHLLSHKIFDGDGIFLAMQGNRMKRANLTYSDYSTPSSADILLNAYRRFLDTAATITRNSGSSNQKQQHTSDDLAIMASAVVGMDNYEDDAPRSEMLDRYNTHTKDCPICSNALQLARRSKRRLGLFQTALHGSAGAMTTASLVLLLAKVTIRSCADSLLESGVFNRLLVVTAAMAWFGSWATLCAENKLDKKINSFIFEDYVHAEKN
jgi:Pheophorbide a oxygenase